MRPRLISLLRRPSVSTLFKCRLISEGRIPGLFLISASVLSRSLPLSIGFAALADLDLFLFASRLWIALLPVLLRRGLCFIAAVLFPDETLTARTSTVQARQLSYAGIADFYRARRTPWFHRELRAGHDRVYSFAVHDPPRTGTSAAWTYAPRHAVDLFTRGTS